MKKSGLILLTGLLFFGLAPGSGEVTGLAPCQFAHTYSDGCCHLASQAYYTTQADSPISLTALQEPAPEQQVVFTNRIVQLVDAFARLVMVI